MGFVCKFISVLIFVRLYLVSYNSTMLKNIVGLTMVLLAALFVARHYITPGLPGTDDGIWAPVRLGSMYRELRQGQFPVRWSGDLNFGYGYPLFHFSYPGVYYAGALFVVAGLGLVDTIKLLFVLGVLSAALGMYFLTHKLVRSTSIAICAALLYCASPYVMTNLYRRGSIGEILAAGILPWIFLSISHTHTNHKNIFHYLTALLVAALILIHNASAMLSLPFIVLFIIWQSSEHTTHAKSLMYKAHLILAQSWRSLASIILGLMMSSFFWLPALVDVQFTKIAGHPLTQIEDWFVSPEKTLLYPLFANAGPDNLDDYRLSIGLVQTLMLLTVVIMAKHRVSNSIWLTGLLVSIVFLFPPSAVFWKNVPVYKSIDFPWRLLTPLSVVIPITIAVLAVSKKPLAHLLYIATTIACVLAIPWIQQRDMLYWPDSQYATNQATATANNEYITKWMPKEAQSQATQQMNSLDNIPIQVTVSSEKSTDRNYLLRTDTPTNIEYALMYFPGWQVTINNHAIPFNYTDNGLLRFTVPQGESNVRIFFEHTPLRLLCNAISLITGVLICTLMLKNAIKRTIKI